VAWTGSEAEFQGFVDRHGLTFPQIADDAGRVYDFYDVPTQPALLVIDPTGEVQAVFGAVDGPEIDELVAEAIA
jgi:peroxiredoxin